MQVVQVVLVAVVVAVAVLVFWLVQQTLAVAVAVE